MARLLIFTRVISGLIMTAFVIGHLGNLAVGIVSVEAMETARPWVMMFWLTGAGHYLLLGAVILHVAAAVVTILTRRHVTTRWLLQIVLGLSIPALLAVHLVAVADVGPASNVQFTYWIILATFWKYAPFYGMLQVLGIVALWFHAMLGIMLVSRHQHWWPTFSAIAAPVAFALPVLALIGFIEGGAEVMARLDNDPDFVQTVLGSFRAMGALARAAHDNIFAFWTWYPLFCAAVLSVPLLRGLALFRLGRKVHIVLPSGRTIRAPVGGSVYQALRRSREPIAGLCQGQGRCGTCRITLDNDAAVSARGGREAAMLEPDLHCRLACQTIATAPGTIRLSAMAVAGEEDEIIARRRQSRRAQAGQPAVAPAEAVT